MCPTSCQLVAGLTVEPIGSLAETSTSSGSLSDIRGLAEPARTAYRFSSR